MTITLDWWAIPVLMLASALLLWWHGSKESGMFGGIVQFLLGCGLMVGALGAIAVGLLK